MADDAAAPKIAPAWGSAGALHMVKRGGRYYASVRVPPRLAAAFGGRSHLRKSLGTGHEPEARRRLPVVVAELRRQIEGARRNPDGTRTDRQPATPARDPIADDAAWWAAHFREAREDPAKLAEAEELFSIEVEQRLGEPTGLGIEEHGAHFVEVPIYDPAREAETGRFVGLVRGTVVPVATELERYLAAEPKSARYASRRRRAVRELADWLETRPGGDNLKTITRYAAWLFVDHLSSLHRSAVTVRSLIGALSAYWRWMKRKGVVAENPWTDQSPAQQETGGDAEKRPFTDDEVKRLLSGETYSTLHDLMRIGALTGMRINEICCLRVVDCADGDFDIRRAKTKAGIRRVPIHPDLKPLVERRSEGKSPDAFLFDELKAPASRPNERSAKASERFTEYRRELEIDERAEGQRQSAVDFHSLRRWFITKAEQAECPPHFISAVVGHKREGMTLGRYSGGPGTDNFKSVVDAVKLPPGAPVCSPDGPRMGDNARAPRKAHQQRP